jgi:hypothetical protein
MSLDPQVAQLLDRPTFVHVSDSELAFERRTAA